MSEARVPSRAQQYADLYYYRLRPAAVLIILLLVLATLTSAVGGAAVDRAVVEGMIYCTIVAGLYTFVGLSGIISFGHVGFMLLGAYVSAWLTCRPSLKLVFTPGLPDFLLQTSAPVFIGAIAAGLAASTFALCTGLALMRLTGIAASIATLALLAVLNTWFENWDSVTAGHSSLVGLPVYVDKWIGFGWAATAIVVAAFFQGSRKGLAVRQTREDEVAARATGVSVYWSRLFSFVLSAFFVGVGGALYGHFLGTIAVDVFWLDMTFITLAMLVVGGMTSLSGAIVGVLLVTTLSTTFRLLGRGFEVGDVVLRMPDGTDKLVLAAIMVAILGFRPRGLMGGAELDELFAAIVRPKRRRSMRAMAGDAETFERDSS